ncbi:MAG: hypothetical protein AAF840_13865 [Bacteroidota bacterium]
MTFITAGVAGQSDLTTDGNSYGFDWDNDEKVRDFVIPANYDPSSSFNQLTFTLRGGDGGKRKIPFICTEPGGNGARVEASFGIGFAEGELKPGGTIRFIVGQRGGSVTAAGLSGAGGGGGTAVLYRDPNTSADNGCTESGFNIPSIEWDTTCWILLAVAGGGGGAYAPGGCAEASSGKPGNAGESGSDGKGGASGNGGTNGRQGRVFSSNSQGGSGGGYRPEPNRSIGNGNFGGIDGGEAGNPGSTSGLGIRGGFGYGGGGQGVRTWLIVHGGGGGGFSGGGHGAQYNGGGGGGSYRNPFSSAGLKQDGNGTDRSPDHGTVSYRFEQNNDLLDPPVAIC